MSRYCGRIINIHELPVYLLVDEFYAQSRAVVRIY